MDQKTDVTKLWRTIKGIDGRAKRDEGVGRQLYIKSISSLPEQTNNVLTGMAPERVRVITEATYEAVATDQEFTLSELEDVLHRLKDTAPGDDTVCNSMIKNVPLATKHLFLRLINQSFSEGKLPTRWKMAKIIPIPKKDKTHRPISLLPVISKVMERLVLARVKWSAQPINPCCCLPTPMALGGVRCSRLWSTSQLLRPSGQQCSHFGGVCPQIQGRQCGAYVGAVEEMMCVVCVDVTEGA